MSTTMKGRGGGGTHELTLQVTGLGSGQPQAVFQLQPLRRLCNAVAPTSNTKKTHLFTRRTPIAQNTNAGSYVTLAEALAVLGVHLGSEQHFTELVVQVSAAAFAAAKRAA